MAERRVIMKELLKSFWTDESGQGLTEYALIIALVAHPADRGSADLPEPVQGRVHNDLQRTRARQQVTVQSG
jgi:hypothetical protein